MSDVYIQVIGKRFKCIGIIICAVISLEMRMGLDEFVCRFGFAHLFCNLSHCIEWKPLSFSSGWIHFMQFLVKQLQHQLTRNERYVWASSLVILHSSKRRPEAHWGIWSDNGEWWCIHQLLPWRFLGFIPDKLDRYTVYTCKMHLRIRQTITVISENCLCISRTLESLQISVMAFCSKSWVCLLHYNEIARNVWKLSIAAGCNWKPVMQKVSTAGSRWEGWTAKFEAAPNGSLITVQSCLALYSSKEDFKVD